MKVFTNGCFDLLHAGHLSILEYCASLGDVIVGVNSDESVRRLKGPSRPIVPQDQRVFALLSCKWVSEVHLFEEDTPIELIRKLNPDIIVKGSEYINQRIIGDEVSEIRLFEPRFDVSTSKIIERILERHR